MKQLFATHQPDTFVFTPENIEAAEKIIAKYPTGGRQSAVMPLLHIAQLQHENWLPRAAMDYVADYLGMPRIRVYEVATFYTMYNLEPVGKHHVQICTTTPCWLRGSDEIVKACEQHLGVKVGETTADGQFTLAEAECLGACVNAPMIQVDTTQDSTYYEDLTPDGVKEILIQLAQGQKPKAGTQNERHTSEPLGGATTLKKSA